MDKSSRSFKMLEMSEKWKPSRKIPSDKVEAFFDSLQPKIKKNWFCNRPLSGSGGDQLSKDKTFQHVKIVDGKIFEENSEQVSCEELVNSTYENQSLWELEQNNVNVNILQDRENLSVPNVDIEIINLKESAEMTREHNGIDAMYGNADSCLHIWPSVHSDKAALGESLLYVENEISTVEGSQYYNIPPDDVVLFASESHALSNISCVLTESESQQNFFNETAAVKKKVIRRPDYCFYCENYVLNFGRHVLRNHSFEMEVIKILSKAKNSVQRKALFASLRKKGNYLKNSQECFKPMHITSVPNRKLLPCPDCLGFYSAKFLYKHRKSCKEGPGTGRNSQACGQNRLLSHLKIDKQLRETVFPKMRADDISLVAKKDFLICAFGTRYLKTHREKHFINVTSRKMREVAKLLIEVKKREPSIKNLFEALQPKYFDVLVDATKTVAGYDCEKDIYHAPTYAMNISSSLKQCCDIAITLNLKKQYTDNAVEDAETEARFKTMIHLLVSNWRFDVSSRAAENLNLNRWNKITIVPLAADLRLLQKYLTAIANDAFRKLNGNPGDSASYTVLLESVYCRTILLNRKRPGELQRMHLHTYENSQHNKANYEEFDTAITPTERILLRKFKRVVIRGKRGRGVPVLFSTEVQEHIKILIDLRRNFLATDNPFLFGNPGCSTPICGYKVLNKYALSSGVKNPKAITATKLRKHLATLSQIFNMNESEIEQLASFMGHTTGVHKNSYRLPDDVYQTAKLSKLLILMETGSSAEYKGKSLDEIDLNLDENLLEEPSDCENIGNEEILSESDDEEMQRESAGTTNIRGIASGNKKSQNKRRELIPWTDEQKRVVTDYFKVHISSKKAPKRTECEKLINQYSELLHNKSWLKIKVFIQNIYTCKTKIKLNATTD